MTSRLVAAHMAAIARLRGFAARGVEQAWSALPGYDEADVPAFIAVAVPFVIAAQRQAVAATDAFLAHATHRAPLGPSATALTGAAARAGTPPEEVYKRPFITLWSALGAGTAYHEAVAQGLARARATATTDVQLAMRATLHDVGERDDLIAGYRRVPNAGACELCRAAGDHAFSTSELMALHTHCACGADVIAAKPGTEPPRAATTFDGDGITARVREHGELGPVLVNAAHHFTEV